MRCEAELGWQDNQYVCCVVYYSRFQGECLHGCLGLQVSISSRIVGRSFSISCADYVPTGCPSAGASGSRRGAIIEEALGLGIKVDFLDAQLGRPPNA